MPSVRKPRNLTDLARQAKVTAATVSLALRDSPQVSPKVKERIRQMAAEWGFTPRTYNRRPKPQPSCSYAHFGSVLVLHYDTDEEDPVRDGILPVIFQRLNQYGIDYQYKSHSEIKANPSLLDQFAGVLYYNDLRGWQLPPELPSVQIFGWDPMGPQQDRITTDDRKIVEIAEEFFRRAGVKRTVIVWREEMVHIPDHPRITGFLARMNAAGLEATPMPFRREDPGFSTRLKSYIESGDDRIGFFGFNAFCGVKLCGVLDGLGLLEKYGPNSILVCDKSLLLNVFYPPPAMIDLNLPTMADRAVQMLLYRLASLSPPSMFVQQSPRLVLRSYS